jgi:hypothetical protein
LQEEEALFGHGRSEDDVAAAGFQRSLAQPGLPKVVWCLPKDSRHVRGRAIDVSWAGYTVIPSAVVKSLCGCLGLEWGGSWKVADVGHFQDKFR